MPQPSKSLTDLVTEGRWLHWFTGFLEVAADQREARDGERVRAGVDEKRQGAAEGEEEAAERPADEACAVLAGLVLRDRRSHLILRDDLRQRAPLGNAEEDRAGHVEKEQREDKREPDPAAGDGKSEAQHRKCPRDLADQHDTPSVPAVEQRTCGDRKS